MIGWLRALVRLMIVVLGAGLCIVFFYATFAFVRDKLAWGLRIRQRYVQMITPLLGLQIMSSGEAPASGGMLACNHRSYIDPFVVLHFVQAVAIGKKEVRSWPILGPAIQMSGAIFVDRSSAESRRQTRAGMRQVMAQGYSILNFPEGTTHIQPTTIDFKPGMFADAVAAGASVYPVAIEYESVEDAWIGDDTFVRHFFDRFARRRIRVYICFGPAISDTDGGALLGKVKDWIDDRLVKLRSEGLEPRR